MGFKNAKFNNMTRQVRRIIFYIFVLFFIILVPVIILYAQGYTFDWEKKTILPTGGVYLKSYPSRAEIYINDKLRGKTNGFVKRLTPKVYNIKISKNDYHTWEKNISVKPGLVTRIGNIFLVPFNPKIFLVATDSEAYTDFTNPYSVPYNELVDLIKKKSKYAIFEINNLNLDSKKEKLYFLSKNNLYFLRIDKANLNNSELSPILVPNVLNYTLYKDGVIYLDYFTEKIFELDLTSLKSAEFFSQVFPGFDQEEWIISNDNMKLLCKKENSIEILWLADAFRETDARKKGDVDKIDLGAKINQVVWYPRTDNNLIVATDDAILITELDNRLPRNTVKFITTEKPEIKYDADNRILYFLSQERLYQTEL